MFFREIKLQDIKNPLKKWVTLLKGGILIEKLYQSFIKTNYYIPNIQNILNYTRIFCIFVSIVLWKG